MDTRLLQTFKQLAKGVYDSQMPADTTAGTVVSVDPLSIKLNEMPFEIPAAIIDISDTFDVIESTFEIEVPTFRMEGESIVEESRKVQGTIQYDNSLKPGDLVHLVRKHGGQRFLVIGRVKQ